jgi:glutamine---fructose-6-phosphate transaminase (isomerizing)
VTPERHPPGAHTLDEILSQPQCWRECRALLREKDLLKCVAREFRAASEWLFIGCGSSYYVAQGAAAAWTTLTGQRARAVPASDLLLYPEQVQAGRKDCHHVLISRSGLTSEVLRAAEYLEEKCNVRTLGITCSATAPLARTCSIAIPLSPADEQSTVMTRSFTSMLITLQALAAVRAKRPDLLDALECLPAGIQPQMETISTQVKDFVRRAPFRDYVFLGQGPFFCIAADAALKVTEMSCSLAQAWHTLEFRHGPKSIVTPQTLVTFFLSETGCEAERSVLTEIKELGATTMVITNTSDGEVRRAADLLFELNLDVPELLRPAAFSLPAQFLGVHTGIAKGLDPDSPRHLTRVVTLDD